MHDETISITDAALESAQLPFRYPGAFLRCCLIYVVLVVAMAVDMAQPEPWFFFSERYETGFFKFRYNFHVIWFPTLLPLLSMIVGLCRLGYFGAAGTEMVGWIKLDRRAWRFVMQAFKVGVVSLMLLAIAKAVHFGIIWGAQFLAIPTSVTALLALLIALPLCWVVLQLGLSVVAALLEDKPVGIFDAWVVKDGVSFRAALMLWLGICGFETAQYLLMQQVNHLPLPYLVEAASMGVLDVMEPWFIPPPFWAAAVAALLGWAQLSWIIVFMAQLYRRLNPSRIETIVEEF